VSDKSSDKKQSRRARALTSASTQAKDKEVKPQPPKKDERLITVEVWGRGNANPLMRAFISEHRNQRTVKRSASEWFDLFRKWKEQPRG